MLSNLFYILLYFIIRLTLKWQFLYANTFPKKTLSQTQLKITNGEKNLIIKRLYIYRYIDFVNIFNFLLIFLLYWDIQNKKIFLLF